MEPFSMNSNKGLVEPMTTLPQLPNLATVVSVAPPLEVKEQQTQNVLPPVINSDVYVAPVEDKPMLLSDSASPSPIRELDVDQNTDTQILNPANLIRQINQLAPSERCSPTQAQSMGKQLLTIIAYHEKNNVSLPVELQNSFDILHRCLAVVYGTFFLNLYSKANAPCLLCHSCKCLYPPGQFIHHTCSSLPPNIVPCRSRMWRRCLVPLVSPGIDKDMQKQRWKFVLEKFSHNAAMASRKNAIPPETEAQLLDMPELKRGRFTTVKTITRKSSEGEIKVHEGEKNGTSNGIEASILDMENADFGLDASSPVDSSLTTGLSTSPVGLAEQLVTEVKRLQKELAVTKGKLQSAAEMIGKLPSEACMREQLAQALCTQQSLTMERDQAKEQARIATDRADRLQKQMDLLRQTHSQMEKHLSL